MESDAVEILPFRLARLETAIQRAVEVGNQASVDLYQATQGMARATERFRDAVRTLQEAARSIDAVLETAVVRPPDLAPWRVLQAEAHYLADSLTDLLKQELRQTRSAAEALLLVPDAQKTGAELVPFPEDYPAAP